MAAFNNVYPAERRRVWQMNDYEALSQAQTDDDWQKFTTVFVGGAPRSGTTVLHALLCTSEKTNPYIAECSYFSAFMYPFLVGLQAFDRHTRDYFGSKDEFLESHAEVLKHVLIKIWRRLGKPEKLVLKDPMLTPGFHHLAGLLPSARFVVSVRDPRDTILSRIEVMIRKDAQDTNITSKQIETLCEEYLQGYRAIAQHRARFGDRLCLVNYKDVVSGKATSQLESFGFRKINPDKIWSESVNGNTVGSDSTDEWATPLLGQKLSTSSVNRYNVLPPEIVELIVRQCAGVAQELGFPPIEGVA